MWKRLLFKKIFKVWLSIIVLRLWEYCGFQGHWLCHMLAESPVHQLWAFSAFLVLLMAVPLPPGLNDTFHLEKALCLRLLCIITRSAVGLPAVPWPELMGKWPQVSVSRCCFLRLNSKNRCYPRNFWFQKIIFVCFELTKLKHKLWVMFINSLGSSMRTIFNVRTCKKIPCVILVW